MRTSLTQFLSADGDDSHIICARRTSPGLLMSNEERERNVLRSVTEYMDYQRVVLVDIGDTIQSYSSSEVREHICRGNELWTAMVVTSVAEYIKVNNLYVKDSKDTIL